MPTSDVPTSDVPSPDVSIVILNWNTLDITIQAMRTLRTATRGVQYEVILIDNGSTADDSAVELPRRFPWARFVANARNEGFCRGCNQGIALATGRYVLLLNSDTVHYEDAVSAAAAYMDAHSDVGALGVLHRNADAGRSPQRSWFSFPDPWAAVRSLLMPGYAETATSGADADGWAARERDVDWCCGSFLMLRTECLRDVGTLDERFFAYDEDIDWCKRAWERGWKVRFWPGAEFVHLGSATQPYIRDKTFVHFRNRLQYFRKHFPATAAGAYYAAMAGRLTGATVMQAVRVLTGRGSVGALRERAVRQARFLRATPGHRGI